MKNQKAVSGHRMLIFVLSVFFICISHTIFTPAAETVRVGCVDLGSFIQIELDGHAFGYGAEYLDKVAEYTGWEYDYIQASWEECLDMLRKGEIDLLCPAEYSEERAEDFLFSSYECCFDYAALIGRKSNNSLYYEDYAGFQDIRVGMIKSNFLNGLFEDYAKLHGFTYKPVYYDTGTQMIEALERGYVEAIVNGNMEYNINQKVLARIDYMPAYFITSKNNTALMERLDQALRQVFIENPYYTAGLYDKYYHKMGRLFSEFTREESAFARNSGPITVLVAPSEYPFEWYDAKEKVCKGAYVDYMRNLERISRLRFEFIPGDADESSGEQVIRGRAQVALSVFDKRPYLSDGSLTFTAPYYDCSFSLVGKKDEPLNLAAHQRIAVVRKADIIQDVLRDKYSQWEIFSYDTPQDCLNAVENGSVDCAMISSLKLSADRNMMGADLVVVDESTADASVYMGVSADADPMLVQVLSKSIAKAGEDAMDEAVYAALLSGSRPRDLSYFVQTYPMYFAAGVVTMSLLGAGVMILCYDSRHQKIQNQILQKKNAELEAAIATQRLLQRKAQTDELTGLKNKNTTEELCRACLENTSGESCALFILDLDDFKHINDQRGHQVGDSVLRAFGTTIRSCVRQDDIAGRIGGDEFMLFMSGVKDEQQLSRFADRIYRALKANPDFEATCSMGIVFTETGKQSYEEMFRAADTALYQAKASGKNKYYIEDWTRQ